MLLGLAIMTRRDSIPVVSSFRVGCSRRSTFEPIRHENLKYGTKAMHRPEIYTTLVCRPLESNLDRCSCPDESILRDSLCGERLDGEPEGW